MSMVRRPCGIPAEDSFAQSEADNYTRELPIDRHQGFLLLSGKSWLKI